MSTPLVDRLVHALLYEGYLLYPYRPGVKNTRRWTFGGLYPRTWSESVRGAEPFWFETQCLVVGDLAAQLRVSVRFLHLLERRFDMGGLSSQPPRDSIVSAERATWQEAVERDVELPPLRVESLLSAPYIHRFAIAGERPGEQIDQTLGKNASAVRRQIDLEGTLQIAAQRLGADAFRVSIRIANETPLSVGDSPKDSDARTSSDNVANEAQLRSFVSTNAILHILDGEFVSLIDPPIERLEATLECRNDKLWPVLVGDAGQRDTLLCSPIILYDYPQIAPESPHDLFDATEIDEILTLRILTLTDEESAQMAATDERGRALLERTRALAEWQLAGLHGTVRSLQSIQEPGRVE